SIPEYQTYNHVHDFLDACEIKDGAAVAPNGKVRKVLFIGFDGMRADALPYVLNNANNSKTGVSGIAELQKKGGIYLAYCGGETGTDTEQTTSTSASWTSHFTGVWGTEHGIKTNDDSKNMQYKTFILEYAEKGLNTSVAFDWDQYFDLNLKEEVKLVMDKNLPMQICDIDRVKKDKLKDTYAETLELYNFIAPETPSASAPYDTGMRDYILERMEAGDDIICGIFHNIDTAGHNFGFGTSTEYSGAVINCDMYAYSVLQAVAEREKNCNEEWLVVFANDHGGIGKGHGEQSLEERTTWIASNIPFDEKYYSQGYDGYNVK
ncbi:MAG: alkaline phosphatase family protein, partial [Eubacterium sp.]